MLDAQEQALRTNSIKFSIDKKTDTPLCRLRGISTEIIRQITSGFCNLAQKENRKRYDKVAPWVHWEIRKVQIRNLRQVV